MVCVSSCEAVDACTYDHEIRFFHCTDGCEKPLEGWRNLRRVMCSCMDGAIRVESRRTAAGTVDTIRSIGSDSVRWSNGRPYDFDAVKQARSVSSMSSLQ